MKKILLSTPKKAKRHLFKIRTEMDKILADKQAHEERKKMPKELSLHDHMNARGMLSHWAGRKDLADKFGISNYSGTREQNSRLLTILQANAQSNAPASNN